MMFLRQTYGNKHHEVEVKKYILKKIEMKSIGTHFERGNSLGGTETAINIAICLSTLMTFIYVER